MEAHAVSTDKALLYEGSKHNAEAKAYLDSLVSIDRIHPLSLPTATSEHFREWLQTGSLINYINYVSDDMLYESETTGGWANADRMLFSVRGNSYEWNRFYLNGFRLDSRFLSGSMLYVPDMQQVSLTTDVERGALWLTDDHSRANRFTLEGNMGGLGGISWGTKQLINLFHSSASERLYKPIEQRNRQLWAGQTSLSFPIPTFYGDTLSQRIYANAGTRRIVTFDEGGESGYYDALYYKIQLDGELPVGPRARSQLLSLHYLFDMQHRPDLYSELGYGASEVADYSGYNASLYLTMPACRSLSIPGNPNLFTTGLTYAMHDARHADASFSRNIVDQDGEGFDPWNSDGRLHEVTWAVNMNYPLLLQESSHPKLSLRLDAYNSLLRFLPTNASWSNQVYCQYEDQAREDWYCYDFTSRAFTAGMLENTLALDLAHRLSDHIDLRASAGLAWDGIILSDKKILLPSWEAELSFLFRPVRWFSADILLGHYRSKYTWNQVRLLSSDYQNGTLTGQYAPYAYYGGQYLAVRKGLQQPEYAVLDIPLVFTVNDRHAGSHTFSILSTARLYYHNWTITDNPDYTGQDDGTRPYLLTYQQPVAGAGFFALPLYLSNVLKYAYQGRHVFFSLSWQSYQMSGLTTLGNGAENNSISTLTYSMLNPSIGENRKNSESSVKALGRLDQDKAYICRVQMGANITQNWQLMLNFHFQDGTPITNYYTENGQLTACNTKGINPSDGHFGMRKDAFFNLDLRLAYRGNINMRNQALDAKGGLPFSVELLGYNLYDFGTALYEYSFDQFMEHGRRTLSLCIPRGLTLKFSVALTPNK